MLSGTLWTDLCEHTYVRAHHLAQGNIYVGFVPKSLRRFLFLFCGRKITKQNKLQLWINIHLAFKRKCIDASWVGFHLLVMIPSAVTGSRTLLANSSLLHYASNAKAESLFPNPGLRYQANCLPEWWTLLWAGTVPVLWLCRQTMTTASRRVAWSKGAARRSWSISLLRDAPANVCGQTSQTPPCRLEAVLSHSLDVKNDAWVKGKTCIGK